MSEKHTPAKLADRPYCVTIFDPNILRSKPFGGRRFTSVADALAWIDRTANPDRFMVDLASAHPTFEQSREAGLKP